MCEYSEGTYHIKTTKRRLYFRGKGESLGGYCHHKQTCSKNQGARGGVPQVQLSGCSEALELWLRVQDWMLSEAEFVGTTHICMSLKKSKRLRATGSRGVKVRQHWWGRVFPKEPQEVTMRNC